MSWEGALEITLQIEPCIIFHHPTLVFKKKIYFKSHLLKDGDRDNIHEYRRQPLKKGRKVPKLGSEVSSQTSHPDVLYKVILRAKGFSFFSLSS